MIVVITIIKELFTTSINKSHKAYSSLNFIVYLFENQTPKELFLVTTSKKCIAPNRLLPFERLIIILKRSKYILAGRAVRGVAPLIS